MTNLTTNEQNLLKEIDSEMKAFHSETIYLSAICYDRESNKTKRATLVSLQKKGYIKMFKHNGEQLIERL